MRTKEEIREELQAQINLYEKAEDSLERIQRKELIDTLRWVLDE